MKLAAVIFAIFASCAEAFSQNPTPSPSPVIREQVTVVANRTETLVADTPASVDVLDRQTISTSAAPVLDDVLRQTPGFSTFRRSSSRNSNPTTQGVSLRGVGASGASRSLVLLDGVPLNDPFGGWIQWNRVSPIEVETVEVLRGGASSLYGDSGLSGAIDIRTRRPVGKLLLSGDASAGSQVTGAASGLIGFKTGSWSGIFKASHFETNGYILVEPAARGTVDMPAGTDSSTLSGRIDKRVGAETVLFFRPSYFQESRTNGTPLQINRTVSRQLILGGDTQGKSGRTLNWRIFGGTQNYDQSFSAVNSSRTSESLNRYQRVPVQDLGGSIQFKALFRSHTFVVGADFRNVLGFTNETAYSSGTAASFLHAGGRQNFVSAYAEDLLNIGKRIVIAGAVRIDHWRNYSALSRTTTIATSTVSMTHFPDRSETAVSPQASVLVHLNDRFAVYANASGSFRSPTLNELYRGFRVGNVMTLAKENLRSERALNGEGGAKYSFKNADLRASGFWTVIERPITNVTLTTTPALITRQRQNAGQTRSRGVEIEAETSLRHLHLSAGYLFADSTVTSFPLNPALIGLAIPQVARHQETFQASYAIGKWLFSAQMRAASSQYDDDLNQFRLEPYAQIDVFGSRQIGANLRLYAAIENMTNMRYSVGRTPVRTLGAPVSMRLGVKWR